MSYRININLHDHLTQHHGQYDDDVDSWEAYVEWMSARCARSQAVSFGKFTEALLAVLQHRKLHITGNRLYIKTLQKFIIMHSPFSNADRTNLLYLWWTYTRSLRKHQTISTFDQFKVAIENNIQDPHN